MERETFVAQAGNRAGTAQLPLTMRSCHEAFWAGIICLSLQQRGAPLGSGAEPAGRGSSDTRAEAVLHWASAKALEQYSETLNQPQPPGTEALSSPAP